MEQVHHFEPGIENKIARAGQQFDFWEAVYFTGRRGLFIRNAFSTNWPVKSITPCRIIGAKHYDLVISMQRIVAARPVARQNHLSLLRQRSTIIPEPAVNLTAEFLNKRQESPCGRRKSNMDWTASIAGMESVVCRTTFHRLRYKYGCMCP